MLRSTACLAGPPAHDEKRIMARAVLLVNYFLAPATIFFSYVLKLLLLVRLTKLHLLMLLLCYSG